MMAVVVEASRLEKDFGGLKAVAGVSLSVGEGELFGLLGPNGSGKTTTIKMLTGQIRPSAGGASVLGVDVLKDPVGVRRLVGIIPEQENPPSFLTAEEYLHFVAKIRGVADANEACCRWFELLDFGGQREILCKDLSRGTRQKLMFAQAFLHRPALAFIDEPLVNLDPIIQRRVKDFLVDFTRGGGTVFLSTHALDIAGEICTRIGILDRGRLVYEGPRKEFRRKKQGLEGFFLSLVGRGDV